VATTVHQKRRDCSGGFKVFASVLLLQHRQIMQELKKATRCKKSCLTPLNTCSACAYYKHTSEVLDETTAREAQHGKE
jgi:hypothetical protein